MCMLISWNGSLRSDHFWMHPIWHFLDFKFCFFQYFCTHKESCIITCIVRNYNQQTLKYSRTQSETHSYSVSPKINQAKSTKFSTLDSQVARKGQLTYISTWSLLVKSKKDPDLPLFLLPGYLFDWPHCLCSAWKNRAKPTSPESRSFIYINLLHL